MPPPARRWTWLFLAAVAALGALSALDPAGMRKQVRLEAEARRLEAENRELRQENVRLRREARALAGDASALERAAREELGYVRPGEIVLQLGDREAARP